MRDWFKFVIALIAILAGLAAIVKLVGQLEFAVGLISLTFGIMAVFWVVTARKSLSIGSSLKDYATIFVFCLSFTLLYSVWEILEKILQWKGVWLYPKYFFISIAYLAFVFAAYKMRSMSREFGFGEESKKIATIIKERKANSRRK